VRWYTGTIRTLIDRGVKHYTAMDILIHFFGILMMICRGVFYYLLGYLLINHITLELNPLAIAVPIVAWVYSFYRYRLLSFNKDWVTRWMLAAVIPLELYAILRDVLMLRSYYLCFFKRKRTW